MKRSGKLEKDIKHWMEIKRGSASNVPYSYGGDYNDSHFRKYTQFSNDYRKLQNEIFKEKAHVPLSRKCLQSSMSTCFVTNDSSKVGHRANPSLRGTNSYTNDYHQPASCKNTFEKKRESDYNSLIFSEKSGVDQFTHPGY